MPIAFLKFNDAVSIFYSKFQFSVFGHRSDVITDPVLAQFFNKAAFYYKEKVLEKRHLLTTSKKAVFEGGEG